MRLAIVTTHPIQYNAPLFVLLAKEPLLQVKIFYTWPQAVQQKKFDPGFGKVIEWDIPLLEGYEYSFVENTSPAPGSHHFKGIINPKLNTEIEKWDADAVLVYGWAFSSHLKCLRYFHGRKLVLFRGDSTLLDETPGIKTFLRRIFLKWVYRHIDYALYVGENNRQYFLKHGLAQKQLLYAPHAIDNKRFSDAGRGYANEGLAIRKKLGVAEGDVLLLFAGKFEKKKNPFFIINLMKKIKDKRLKALFAGNGELEQQLKDEARGDERVLFMGFQNQQQMPAVYRAADLFILPSKGPGETWGLAINEAMACGIAVAASNKAGGAVDLIDNNVNGLVFDAAGYADVEMFLEKALQNKNILQAMGRQSSAKVARFSFENIAKPIAMLAENYKKK